MPTAADPVAIAIEPVVPELDVPVLTLIAPLVPAQPPSAVVMLIAPLDFASPWPLQTWTDPPVAVDALPADTVSAPPSVLPCPTFKEIPPLVPAEAVPVTTAISPESHEAAPDWRRKTPDPPLSPDTAL